MAVSTKDGVTVLTPTAWKWFVGALAVFFIVPGLGWIIAGIFALMGAGVLQRLTLNPEGIQVRNWLSTKAYAWSDISDFRVYKVRSGLMTAANMVSFHPRRQRWQPDGQCREILGRWDRYHPGGWYAGEKVSASAGSLQTWVYSERQRTTGDSIDAEFAGIRERARIEIRPCPTRKGGKAQEAPSSRGSGHAACAAETGLQTTKSRRHAQSEISTRSRRRRPVWAASIRFAVQFLMRLVEARPGLS